MSCKKRHSVRKLERIKQCYSCPKLNRVSQPKSQHNCLRQKFFPHHQLFVSSSLPTDVYIVPITTKQFIYEIKHPLRLRGDVIIRCFQLVPNVALGLTERELISSVQFHTCAITHTEVVFRRTELDFAYYGKKNLSLNLEKQ